MAITPAEYPLPPYEPVSDFKYGQVLVHYPELSLPAHRQATAIAEIMPGSRLGQAGVRLTLLPTVPDVPTNTEDLRDKLETAENSALLIPGGDGMANRGLRGAYAAKTNVDTAIIKLGNANDLNWMTRHHDDHTIVDWLRTSMAGQEKHPLNVLFSSRTRALRPLEITTQQPDGQVSQELAFGYFSVGLSARIANKINARGYRDSVRDMSKLGRFGQETKLIAAQLPDTQPYTIHDAHGTRQVSDTVFANGQRMAKSIRFGRVSLFDEKAAHVEIKPISSLLQLLKGVGTIALGYHAVFAPGDSYDFTVESPQGVFAQADGEAMVYPSGTHFSVRLSERTVNLIVST